MGFSNAPVNTINGLLGVWRRQWRSGHVTDAEYRQALDQLAQAVEVEQQALDTGTLRRSA
jgi:hypothetical protein